MCIRLSSVTTSSVRATVNCCFCPVDLLTNRWTRVIRSGPTAEDQKEKDKATVDMDTIAALHKK